MHSLISLFSAAIGKP